MRAWLAPLLVNMATNLARFGLLHPGWSARYSPLPMVVAMIAGSYVGSHLAMKGGNS